MKLQSAHFNSLLNRLGQDFAWRKGYACPCANPVSGSPKNNCPQCSGRGRVWDAPINGAAGVISRDRLYKYAAFGPWENDDLFLSIGSDSVLYDMGLFDRVMALNRSEPFSVTFVPGRNDTLRFPVISVDRAFILEDGDITDIDLPTIKADGTLEWAFAPNVPYSLTGRRIPEYYVHVNIPVDRPLHHGEQLPRRCVLRRFDLMGR